MNQRFQEKELDNPTRLGSSARGTLAVNVMHDEHQLKEIIVRLQLLRNLKRAYYCKNTF